MKLARIVVPLAAVALLGAACGGDGGGDGGGTTADSVTMVDNAFEPESVSVAADSSLSVTNEGQAAHTFTLEDGSIDEQVSPGDSTTVDITLEAGDYPFECTFHPEMTGTLTVE
jgi:plastocyanin